MEAQRKTKQQVTPVGWRVVWIMHVEDVWDRHLRCGELVPLHLLPFCLLLLLRASELAKQEADSFQVSLEPQIILSDFEFATKQAVELWFPTTDFRGCYYHFSQALISSKILAYKLPTEKMQISTDFFKELLH